MFGGPSFEFSSKHAVSICLIVMATMALPGCGLEFPNIQPTEFERFDLSSIAPASHPPRPAGEQITEYAVEYVTDLGVPDGQPGYESEVRVVLPSQMPNGKVPALVVNGAGAYLFSGMVLSDEDIEPMLPYVAQGFAIVAYETDGCQPDFSREPSGAEISQMARHYVASKAGLINAERALSYALDRFPEIDAEQLYAIGHSSGGKQALLLSTHDERIRGCVAFAPACQMDFGSAMTVARIGGPDAGSLSREIERSMPISHAKETNVPMLLIYSPNDRVTRPTEVLTYAKAVGQSAEAIPVDCEGHGSVPDAGFELALTWLRAQSDQASEESSATTLVSDSGPEPVESPNLQHGEASDIIPEHGFNASVPTPNAPAEKLTTPVRRSQSGNQEQAPWSIRRNPFVTD